MNMILFEIRTRLMAFNTFRVLDDFRYRNPLAPEVVAVGRMQGRTAATRADFTGMKHAGACGEAKTCVRVSALVILTINSSF